MAIDTYQVISTPTFTKCIRELGKKAKEGKVAIQKALAAQTQAAIDGVITLVQHTQNGETRLPNVEKYNLGNGYRLVVQLVDPATRTRVFLFVGDHEDAESWLNNHKNYRWVEGDGDKKLNFVQVTDPEERLSVIPRIDVESPDALLDLPLLRDITDVEWDSSGLPAAAVDYLKAATTNSWEQNPFEIVQQVERLTNTDHACFAFDVLDHAHKREWNELHRRFAVTAGTSKVVDGSAAASAMIDTVNSEQFVTWEDIAELPPNADWADWMLFLHPEQKQLAKRDLAGAARLRGVSGSGKTCVMVHRARYLAKKYRQPILVVTLTESMRKLLDNLIRVLCGAEQSLITTYTVAGFTREVIRTSDPTFASSYEVALPARLNEIARNARTLVRQHSEFAKASLRHLDDSALLNFLVEEIAYVRTRLRGKDYEIYPTKSFRRRGRSRNLEERSRRVCLEAVKLWDQQLGKSHTLDYEGIAQAAFELVLAQVEGKAKGQWRWRAVLVDEVQDLSQLELSLFGSLLSPDGERIATIPDGLFMVGDGAQSIYKKGFSLGSIGISVYNRSFVYKKNYRNTREILTAAYGLIKEFEFADVDEDNVQRPLEPDFATRHGELPLLVKCQTLQQESEFVAHRIKELLDDRNQSPAQVCVIGPNQESRDGVAQALKRLSIPCIELREDARLEGDRVKISTIESSKGHEFVAVFIVGLIEGVLPSRNGEEDDLPREAARLYVAMTRARDRLCLSYNIGGCSGPSPFLSAIQNDCQECEFKNGMLVVAE